MSLEVAVAIPFRARGVREMNESEFVVALSLDRDWFSPDQAKRLVGVAAGRGLVATDDGSVTVQFDPGSVSVPEEFTPDESILREASVFERVLDSIVAAGIEKQDAVAAINRRQQDLAVTPEAAAILYARGRGIDVDDVADAALQNLDG